MEEEKNETIVEQESVNTEDVQQEEKKEESAIAKETKMAVFKKLIKNNKKFIIIALIIIALVILFFALRSTFVVASVDGRLISRASITQKLEKQYGTALLDSIITEKLIENEVRAQKIVISKEDVSAEIKKIEASVTAQGAKIDDLLEQQGMTRADLEKQIKLQKQVEKLVGDRVNVTDEEVAKYIKDSNTVVPKGEEAATNEQIRSQLSSQKVNTEIQAKIDDLKEKAKIKYFTKY